MLAYFLKVNVAIALFYAFYRLFFYKDTFFGWRRTALLCFFAVSAAVPLLNIETWVTEQEPMVTMADLYASVVLPEFTVGTKAATTDWKSILATVARASYWGIVALLLVRFAGQLAGIVRLACRCRKVQIGGASIYLLPRAGGPFSFFHWIFVHPSAHTEEELDEILTHEQTHARQWHSIDVLIGELACIFCWCNPFAWLMKREIRTNLEYMADARVLAHGYDSKTYQYHLLGLAHHKAAATIYNSFNVLPLKKRIKMMNKKRTKKIGRTKYLMFLPLVALLLIVSNIESVAHTTLAAPQPEQDAKTVTYKGKVVDKAGKPMKGVEIFSDWKYKKNKTYTKADGSFELTISEEAPILFGLTDEQGQQRIFAFVRDRRPKGAERENWVVTYGEDWPVFVKEEPSPSNETVYEVVDEMPEFPGGMSALMGYISKNLKYPKEAVEKKIQGRATVQFVVERDGSINNVRILRSAAPELDAETIRVISSMPKWKPGRQDGKLVPVQFTVPVVFSLGESNSPKGAN